MTTITRIDPASRTSEGAASIERLHEAWRTGALRVAPATPAHRRASMTADPLLLDSGIPTLTQRQAARRHRSVPHLHLVHRVDTEKDIPEGLDGVAIGYTALPEERAHATDDDADLYQAEPIVPVDRRLRANTWRAIVGVYAAAAVAVVLVVVASRHQPQIAEGLRIARQAVALFLLGA